jgi:hypothetical protein
VIHANVAGILSRVTLGALVGEADHQPLDSPGRMSGQATGTVPSETVEHTTSLAVQAASSAACLRMIPPGATTMTFHAQEVSVLVVVVEAAVEDDLDGSLVIGFAPGDDIILIDALLIC